MLTFDEILHRAYGSNADRRLKQFSGTSIGSGIRATVGEEDALVFVWSYRFCPASIVESQLAHKEFVWADRAVAILVTDRTSKDPAVQMKLGMIRNQSNVNRRIDFPIYILATGESRGSHRCGMGALYERLFATGVENNFKVTKKTSDGKASFQLVMLK